MKKAVVTITESGKRTAELLVGTLPDARHYHNTETGGLPALTAELFYRYEGLIFIMATGIVVRMISPLLTDKYRDPAVVAVDDNRRYAISLLSGHEGGANRLAWETAAILGAEPVVTTATETNKRITIGIGCRRGVTTAEVREAVLSALRDAGRSTEKRRASFEEAGSALARVQCAATIDQVRCAATIDLKKDETGLLEAMNELDIPLLFFSKERINSFGQTAPDIPAYGGADTGKFEENEVTMRRLGVKAVAEPCALLAGRQTEIILAKTIYGKVTVAVAREKDHRCRVPFSEGGERSAALRLANGRPAGQPTGGRDPALDRPTAEPSPAWRPAGQPTGGKLAIIGIGPGNIDEISPRAVKALTRADVVVGYTRYIGFIESLVPGKEVYTSGMRREKERAEYAVEAARQGKSVAVVSGGDAGVYGLAGLVLELLDEVNAERVRIEIIPGITAATAAAAALGAPLMHDFAVISLSDLLTDTDRIRDRLHAAAAGDFVTVIYNPKSKKREKLFSELPEIFLPHRRSDTPVGIVTDVGRNGEARLITTLADLPKTADRVQMGTTLIIGNSRTMVKGGFIITPRGYKL